MEPEPTTADATVPAMPSVEEGTPPASFVERTQGCIAGTYAGDAFGAPFEGESSASVQRICNGALPLDIADSRAFPDALASAAAAGLGDLREVQPDSRGNYTDDTEMTMALAEALLASISAARGGTEESPHPALVAAYSALWFYRTPARGGYSAGTWQKLKALGQKLGACGDIDQDDELIQGVNETLQVESSAPSAGIAAGGSFGNGAPMRIALVGLALHGLAQRACGPSYDALRAAVRRAINFTHSHEEALDASTVVALLAGRLAVQNGPLDCDALLQELVDASTTAELQSRLRAVSEFLREPELGLETERRDEAFFWKQIDEDKAKLQSVTTDGKWFQIRAVDAVAYVLYVLFRYGDLASGQNKSSFHQVPTAAEEVLIRIIAIGGDTDTLAAIAGALLGCRYGHSWIPKRWIDMFEADETVGYPAAVALGSRLAEQIEQQSGHNSATTLTAASYLRDICSQLSLLPPPVRHEGFA